jgi:hypothetical protein
MENDVRNKPIQLRRVVHFSGFEPLDHLAHRVRFKRALSISGRTFGFKTKVAETAFLATGSNIQTPQFSVIATGPNWQTESQITILEHNQLIMERLARPFWRTILSGCYAGLLVVIFGGFFNYARTAWRVALFFLFPYLLLAASVLLTGLVIAVPLVCGIHAFHPVWSAPLGALLFMRVFLPFMERFHVLLLFANCRISVEIVGKKSALLTQTQEQFVVSLAAVLNQPADEYLISSHSMGASLMIDALGSVLQANPSVLDGKRVVICTMGGAGYQCTLMRPARLLRQKAMLIVEHPNIFWMDIQCLTDILNFYKVSFTKAFRRPNLKNPHIIYIRMKHMLTPIGYGRLKKDSLLMHRQYVLGSEVRSKFDYNLMAVSPFSAAQFVEFTSENLLPLAADGAMFA